MFICVWQLWCCVVCWFQAGQAASKKPGDQEAIELALNPDELDLDSAAIQAKYDQQMRESHLAKEDLSDMVAEHAAKQKVSVILFLQEYCNTYILIITITKYICYWAPQP